MKILYVITKSTWGGAQKYVYDLSSNLPRKDFDVVVAAGGSGELMAKLEAAGIRTIKIPFLRRDINVIKEFLSLFALIKIFKSERPDIIHLNSTKVGGLGAAAARILSLITRHSSLIIFTAHGWGFNEDRPYIARLVIFLAQWVTVLFCHKVVALSRAVHNQAAYFPFARKKLYFTEQGIKSPLFLPKQNARSELKHLLNRTIPLNKKFLWVGSVAELTKNKGLTYLVDATHQLKFKNQNLKFKILIIGDGEDRKMLEEKIKNYGLENTVLLAGFLESASKYLKAFDIFVLPSITEALGYVLIEAGYAGLPVVATKVGGIPWIIKEGESGFLVPSKNPQALADAVEQLAGNSNLRRRFGAKNLKLVSQKFSFEKMLKETVDIYTKP